MRSLDALRCTFEGFSPPINALIATLNPMLVISNAEDHRKSGQCHIFAIFNEDFKCFNDFTLFTASTKNLNVQLHKCRNITFMLQNCVYSSREWMAVILIVFIRPHHMLLLHLCFIRSLFRGKYVRPPCQCFAHRTFCLRVLIRCMSTSVDLL